MSKLKIPVAERAKMRQEANLKFKSAFHAHNLRTAQDPIIASIDNFKAKLPSVVRLYMPKAIRNPQNFRAKTKSVNYAKITNEFLRFTFGKYKVPDHIADFAVSSITMGLNSAIGIYVCVATGGSFHKEHGAEFNFTKKESHAFLTAKNLNFNQAKVFAVAKTFANDALAFRIARSKLHLETNTPFLKAVIYFFARNPLDSINEIDDLFDYLKAEVKEPEKLSGLTLDVLRKKTKDWHYALRRMKLMGNHSWIGDSTDDWLFSEGDEFNKVVWKVTQIKTSKRLLEEGQQMHHCVYSYMDLCINGKCAIWSLTKETFGKIERRVTIETRQKSIVQARRKANFDLKPEDQRILNMWKRYFHYGATM